MYIDFYLQEYIKSFLVNCDKCNKLNIYSKEQKCCICKKYSCHECDNLRKVFGFFDNNYCNFCYQCFYREFIP